MSLGGEFGSRVFLKPLHPLTASFGGFGLFLFFLNTRLVVESAFLDLREEPLFRQFLLEIPDGLFDLIVLDDDFHFLSAFFIG